MQMDQSNGDDELVLNPKQSILQPPVPADIDEVEELARKHTDWGVYVCYAQAAGRYTDVIDEDDVEEPDVDATTADEALDGTHEEPVHWRELSDEVIVQTGAEEGSTGRSSTALASSRLSSLSAPLPPHSSSALCVRSTPLLPTPTRSTTRTCSTATLEP